ncbi:hypothetical protein P0O15_06335 [Methanotrichaceae archaeon Mx]|uniref:AMP-dependent synthetase/ligase domain-containing protein n=1 Tax=Candidatus Methanocrinis natronophilus TaxID=3033396 RepID=A0ABT5X879_9EURY|nr:hypothetical protein [Candidatus Methanocrinis natronophilus]MDF0590787.1 hypothetical protein [Candidatus Methanocrinis natronophilus]
MAGLQRGGRRLLAGLREAHRRRGDGDRRRPPPLLHLRDDRHPQDGEARPHLPPLPHPDGAVLAERSRGRPPLQRSRFGWAKCVWGQIYGQWIGGSAVFAYDYDRSDAGRMMEMATKFGVTTFCAPPTIYRFMIKGDMLKYGFSLLRYAVTA